MSQSLGSRPAPAARRGRHRPLGPPVHRSSLARHSASCVRTLRRLPLVRPTTGGAHLSCSPLTSRSLLWLPTTCRRAHRPSQLHLEQSRSSSTAVRLSPSPRPPNAEPNRELMSSTRRPRAQVCSSASRPCSRFPLTLPPAVYEQRAPLKRQERDWSRQLAAVTARSAPLTQQMQSIVRPVSRSNDEARLLMPLAAAAERARRVEPTGGARFAERADGHTDRCALSPLSSRRRATSRSPAR